MRRVVAPALVAALLTACVAVAPPAPTPTAEPTPAVPYVAREFLRLLERRDAAQAAGNVADVLVLMATDAPATMRARETAMAEAAPRRAGHPPQRTYVAIDLRNGLWTIEVGELDDQGRERRVRWFASGTPDALRLTEPFNEALGPEIVQESEGITMRFRAIDAAQAPVVLAAARTAIAELGQRLGDPYVPARSDPIQLTLVPAFPPGLPPFASAIVDGPSVRLLTTASMHVDQGPGVRWTQTLVTHELAHVLLFRRGNATFLFNEGLPLWLTDDRRQPELDRLVAAGGLWPLERLVSGPRDPTEFFAGYAQASSFTRFVASRWGDRAVIAAWEAGRANPFAEAFRIGIGTSLDEAYAAWRASLGR